MNYIDKVILKNFQSHKNSSIEFDNELNVIVGPSDSGKTAILRAIKWALYNEPSGDYFIREGENECSVTISFNDGTRIKRYRSKSKNIYYLYDSNNNETKFEGFGTTVPQEILDKTGIQKVLLDNDQSRAINLSDQLEGAFLLSEKGSLRANSIGRLVGVNVIDDSLRETLKDIRNLSNDKRNIDNKVIELETELKEYDYLEDLKIVINKIESIRNEISEKQKLQVKLNDLFKKLSETTKEKLKIENYVSKLKSIDFIDILIKDISLGIIKYNHLSNHQKKLFNIKKDGKINLNLISSLQHIDSIEENIQSIDSKYKSEIKLLKIKTNLDNNKIEIQKLKEIINKSNQLEELQALINKIDNKSQNIDMITKIHEKKMEVEKSLNLGQKYLGQLINIDKVSKLHGIIENKINLLTKLEKISTQYNINQTETNNLNKALIDINKSFKKDLNIYKDLLISQETCPLCFSNIDNDKIENIINHYN